MKNPKAKLHASKPETRNSKLVGLLGHPVEHSLSPVMHNAAFRAQGIDATYVAFDVPPSALGDAVRGLQALGAWGANVTIPHKQAVVPLLGTLSPAAEAIGAVNTIVRRGDTLHGDNTDAEGFAAPLRPYADQLADREMLVFGAGGAARAVVYALLAAFRPARLTLAARRLAQAEALAADFAPLDTNGALATVPLADAGAAMRSSALVVNTTPLGQAPHTNATVWPHVADFHADQLAYDLVYTPRDTRFLRNAAAAGATPLGGRDMLIGQAAAAYVQWTGQPMPLDVVREALGAVGF